MLRPAPCHDVQENPSSGGQGMITDEQAIHWLWEQYKAARSVREIDLWFELFAMNRRNQKGVCYLSDEILRIKTNACIRREKNLSDTRMTYGGGSMGIFIKSLDGE